MPITEGKSRITTGLAQPGRPFTDLCLRFNEAGKMVSFAAQVNVLFTDGDQGPVTLDLVPRLSTAQADTLKILLTAIGVAVKGAVE